MHFYFILKISFILILLCIYFEMYFILLVFFGFLSDKTRIIKLVGIYLNVFYLFFALIRKIWWQM